MEKHIVDFQGPKVEGQQPFLDLVISLGDSAVARSECEAKVMRNALALIQQSPSDRGPDIAKTALMLADSLKKAST